MNGSKSNKLTFLVIIITLFVIQACVTSKKSEISLPGVLKEIRINTLNYNVISVIEDSVILEVRIGGKIFHTKDNRIGNISFIHVAEDNPMSNKEVINIWINESSGESSISGIEYFEKRNSVFFKMSYVYQFKLRKGVVYILKCGNKQKKIIL